MPICFSCIIIILFKLNQFNQSLNTIGNILMLLLNEQLLDEDDLLVNSFLFKFKLFFVYNFKFILNTFNIQLFQFLGRFYIILRLIKNKKYQTEKIDTQGSAHTTH